MMMMMMYRKSILKPSIRFDIEPMYRYFNRASLVRLADTAQQLLAGLASPPTVDGVISA